MALPQHGQQKNDSGSVKGATHDGFLYRYLIILTIKKLQPIRPIKGSVLMLTNTICVKYGPLAQLSEAASMRFIAQNTSIPVPKVYCSFRHNACTYIVMERIKGEMIGIGWVNKRSEESKAKLLSQLKTMVEEMRTLSPPPRSKDKMKITAIYGGHLYDCRVPGTTLTFGPFRSVRDFQRHLRRGMEYDDRLDLEVRELITQQEQDDDKWPLVFTHGDLSSLNILVRGDENVGIIDWQTAGWYPCYWEYTTACQVNPQNFFWMHEIDRFLQPMPEELAMERACQRYFGDS